MSSASRWVLIDSSAYFALMGRLRIATAFAFDIHFRQYGQLVVLP